VVAAVHDPRSTGVGTYVQRLAQALTQLGLDYQPSERPLPGAQAHYHLANSTRSVIPLAARQRGRFLLTVHDVMPRTAALKPLQRLIVAPLCIRRATIAIVHSNHAADVLARTSGLSRNRIEVVPMPAPLTPIPADPDDRQARIALQLEPDGPPLFVLPGSLRPAKLVAETIEASKPLIATHRMRLLLAGGGAEPDLIEHARAAGVAVLNSPPADTYAQAIVAADAVICARRDSVGETNGPLLDAIGAGRPSIITAVGSAPESAGASARVVAPTAAGLRAGIEALLDPAERAERAGAARERARALTWSACAEAHRELLERIAA
jgi:glycosyltransferase involved in cell wall biosynthesis